MIFLTCHKFMRIPNILKCKVGKGFLKFVKTAFMQNFMILAFDVAVFFYVNAPVDENVIRCPQVSLFTLCNVFRDNFYGVSIIKETLRAKDLVEHFVN